MKSLSNLLSDFRAARVGMEKLTADIPRIMGTSAVKVIKQNFTLQGYDSGTGIASWEKRDPKTDAAYDRGRTTKKDGTKSKYRNGKNASYKGSVYNSENPVLMQTRNLYNSIKYQIIGKTVIIGVDLNIVPYGQKMNEGGNGTPARKFMPKPNEGPNIKMLKDIEKKVISEREKALREFKK